MFSPFNGLSCALTLVFSDNNHPFCVASDSDIHRGYYQNTFSCVWVLNIVRPGMQHVFKQLGLRRQEVQVIRTLGTVGNDVFVVL